MKKIYLILFTLIFVIGFIFRFYDLGKVPNSLNWDEVSWGYNAFSILKTGHDEHGAFMPLSFQAFGDFKQPVYVYMASLSIGIFGLSSFAVRFPSALLGVMTVPFVWLLVFELFRREKFRYSLALCSMFFFAISPWSIQFSRIAYEANIGLFFVISGVSLFLRGINSKTYWISYLSIVLLALSGYSYHSNKLFTPLLFMGFLTFAYFSLKVSKKYILIFFLLFILGNLLWIVDARTTSRGRSVTFLANQTPILQNSTAELIYDNKNYDALGVLLHNRRIVYLNRYFENYLSHFDPNYLFITGDDARHHAFGMGVLFLVSLPLIIIGFVTLDKRKYWLVLLWLLLGPVASAFAIDAPNASRSLVTLPTWQILEALGLVALFSLKQGRVRSILLAGFCLLLALNLIYYVHNYFNHTNSEYGTYWQNGYSEAMIAANEYGNLGKRVIVSEKFEQAYIFYLFHTQYSPEKYIASGGSGRIKQKCFAIGSVYFGNCKQYFMSGTIFISPDALRNNRFLKIRDIYDRRGLKVGEVNEYL